MQLKPYIPLIILYNTSLCADTKYQGHVTLNLSHMDDDLGNGDNHLHSIGHKESQKVGSSLYQSISKWSFNSTMGK